MMFSVKGGTWWYSSKSDPRWCCSGHVDVMIITSGPPRDALEKYEEMKKLYGEPPEDLYYGCMKD